MAVNGWVSAPVYLDHNATCPVAPEVCEAITNALTEYCGNPSSSYVLGVNAKNVIENARECVAEMINAGSTSDIVFTSGGTEANHLAMLSVVKSFGCLNHACQAGDRLPHVIASSIEHPSVTKLLQVLVAEHVCTCTFVTPSPGSGRVQVSDMLSAIQQNTCLISLMLANNETGVLQPVQEVADKVQAINCSRKTRIFVHTDAAQAIGKILVDVQQLKVDYLSIVGHKFYGPRIGALYVRSPNVPGGAPLQPIFFGGDQENGFRAGTENTPMIVGLGEAAKLVTGRLQDDEKKFEYLRNYLESSLEAHVRKTVVHFQACPRLPNTSSVAFACMKMTSKELLSRVSFYASTSAACHSKDTSSCVLKICGISPELACKTVRFSVGRNTTTEQIDEVVKELQKILG